VLQSNEVAHVHTVFFAAQVWKFEVSARGRSRDFDFDLSRMNSVQWPS
jgi:hypothetical protein